MSTTRGPPTAWWPDSQAQRRPLLPRDDWRVRHLGPGPERDVAFAHMLAQLDAQAEALRAVTFPVLGLTAPHPVPAALSAMSTSNGRIGLVELSYGDRVQVTGPVIVVRSAPADTASSMTFGVAVDRSSPTASSERVGQEVGVLVEGSPAPARRVERDDGWVLHCATTVDGVPIVVDVEGRALSPSTLALTRIVDFAPLLATQRERLEHLWNQPPAPGPESWHLPPATGLEGHEALVEMVLSDRLHRARPDDRRSPLPPDWGRRWETATRAQMTLAGEDRRSAEDAVGSMVNHLTHLAAEAPWFHDERLATLAIDETIRQVARGEDVASSPARRAWSRYWDNRLPPFGTEALTGMPQAVETEERLSWHLDSKRRKDAWQAAWDTWVEEKSR